MDKSAGEIEYHRLGRQPAIVLHAVNIRWLNLTMLSAVQHEILVRED